MVKREETLGNKPSKLPPERSPGESGGVEHVKLLTWRRDWHMFKSYAAKVWLSMKFHFIGKSPGEWGKGIALHLFSDGSQAGRQTFSQPGSPLVLSEFPRFSSHSTGVSVSCVSGSRQHRFQVTCPLLQLRGLLTYIMDNFFSFSFLATSGALAVSFLLHIDFHLELSLAFSVSPLLLLGTWLYYFAHIFRWHLSIFMVLNNHGWRFGNHFTHHIQWGRISLT